MSAHRTEDDFLDSIGRLVSDHAKRSDALDRTREATAERQEAFLLAFSEKARNEVEPALERVAEAINRAGKVKAHVSLGHNGDEDRLRFSVTVSTEGLRVSELLFKADPLKLRVTLHQGTITLGGLDQISELRELHQGQAPVIGTLTLDQFEANEVRSRIEAFLRSVLG